MLLFELQSYIKAARNGSHKYAPVADTSETSVSNQEDKSHAAASLLALMATRVTGRPPQQESDDKTQQESDDKIEQV